MKKTRISTAAALALTAVLALSACSPPREVPSEATVENSTGGPATPSIAVTGTPTAATATTTDTATALTTEPATVQYDEFGNVISTESAVVGENSAVTTATATN